MKRALHDRKKTLRNSAGSLLVPGILFEASVFKLYKNSTPVNRPSYSFFMNKIHLPLSYQAAMRSVLIFRRVTFEDNRSTNLICTRSVGVLIKSRNLKYP